MNRRKWYSAVVLIWGFLMWGVVAASAWRSMLDGGPQATEILLASAATIGAVVLLAVLACGLLMWWARRKP